MDANHDGSISLSEIQNTLRDPSTQMKVGSLITQHESEWVKSMDRWKYIEQYIPDATRYDWDYEKQKIQNLAWWDEVKGKVTGFPNGDAFYFHPAGFVGNFMGGGCQITGNLLIKLLGKSTFFTHRNVSGYPEVYNTHANTFAEVFNKVLGRYRAFDKCVYRAHFLAQAFHEADHFNTTKEYASGWDYDVRTYPANTCSVHGSSSRRCRRRNQIISEGNTSIGDGPKYKGKGLIQLTWKSAYQAYSNFKGEDFVSNPELLASNLEYAIDSSCFFWTKFKGDNFFNNLIDSIENNPANSSLSREALDDLIVLGVTRRVNGGTRGLSERQSLFREISKEMRGSF